MTGLTCLLAAPARPAVFLRRPVDPDGAQALSLSSLSPDRLRPPPAALHQTITNPGRRSDRS
jgi:hypothetical protein